MAQWIPIIPYILEADAQERCMIQRKELDSSYPAHGHDYLEIELFLAGHGRQWVNNTLVPFEAGSLFLLSPSDFPRVEVDAPSKVVTIHLLPDRIAPLGLPDIQAAYALRLPAEKQERFTSVLSALADSTSEAYHEQELTLVATQLIIELLRHGDCYPLSQPGRRLQHALKYIQEHHTDPSLRLHDVARECGLSPTHFSKVFAETVGCHFTDYLAAYRLQHACVLLKSTDESITGIAYDVGFASVANFFRCFKKVNGCTPSAFRNVT